MLLFNVLGEGAQMVEMLLNRIVEEWNIDKSRRLKGNGTPGLPEPTVKLYTMAVDTWAKVSANVKNSIL